MKPRMAGILPWLAFFLAAGGLLQAQGTDVDSLCRRHGMDQEEHIVTIKRAYVDAVASGISEEELYPFVEEILQHKLDCAQMVRVLSASTQLRREGLPYFTVLSKVREGVAKEAAPALVVEAAESKLKTLTASREVLRSLQSSGYRVLDFQNAAIIVSSYIEKGYSSNEIVSQIRKKGVQGAGFAALSGVVEKTAKRKAR